MRSSRAARLLVFIAAGPLAGLLGAAAAAGDYGNGETAPGADLVSADYQRLEQGDDTTVSAAISRDGRYVVIQTRARNFFADDDPDPPGQYRAGGVFRFDLQTRVLAKVADGDLHNESNNSLVRRGAGNPSLSADGRYVAFTTAQPLLASDTNDNFDVYVRDMNLAFGQPGAFDLVSARDGGDVPAAYGPPANPVAGSNPGSDVSRGVAISADGQKVAFSTDAPSNLPAGGAADVPAGQLFVRDRALNATTLVTTTSAGGAPAGGVFNAGISADGTTVAWTGANAPAQTRFLDGENDDPNFAYYLWRRIADGPAAPTRRITGLADPDDPSCPSGSTTFFDATSTGPCYGPLTEQEANRSSIIAQVPALSGDGWTVAFVTGSGPRPNASTGLNLDLYVTDMHPGLTRKQATVELTRDPSSADLASSPPISGIAMSSDGRYLALATARTAFALPALRLLGTARSSPGVRDLYMADLQDRTIERVTRSYARGDIDGDVGAAISVSGNGDRVAFISFAGNLFFGDANQRADAFVATRQPDPATGGPPEDLGSGPPGGVVEEPRLRGRARSRRNGKVRVEVEVPAAGDLKVVADANVGKPPKRRTVATETVPVEAAGTAQVVLQMVRRYREELREQGEVRGRARLSFVSAVGGERRTGAVKVVFRP